MKRAVTGIVTALVMAMSAVAGAPAANAHRFNTWFWTELHADFKYETRYDVKRVQCYGFGRRIRTDNGRAWMYKHFDCLVWHWDGTKEDDELHVKSRRGFIVYD